MVSWLEATQRLLQSGLILILAAWAITWILVTALKWVGAGDRSGVILPLQVSGKGSDDQAAIGKTLAMLLQGRLQEVRRQLEVVDKLLDSSPTGRVNVAPPELPGLRRVSLNQKLFEPLDISLSLGGLEVGGLIRRLQELAMRDRALRIAIHFEDREEGSDEAIVSADLSPLGLQPLSFKSTDVSPSALVDQIAYGIARQQQAQSNRELGLLEPDQFLTVVSTLHEVAKKNDQVRKGLDADPSFEELLDELESLEPALSGWVAFLRVEVQVAENAKDSAAIERLCRQLIKLSKEDSQERKWAEERLAALETLPGRTELSRSRTGSLSAVDRVREIGRHLGLGDREAGGKALVAIFGEMPAEKELHESLAKRSRQLVKPDPASKNSSEDGSLRAYTATMMYQVSLMAPEAELLIVDVTVANFEQLSATVERLGDPPTGRGVALLPLGPLPKKVLSLLPKMADRGWIFVIPAGNDPRRADAGLIELAQKGDLLLIGSVDDKGQPSAFSVQADGVVYAPGQDIPSLQLIGNSRFMSGTGPASALAAGVAAQVVAESTAKTSRELIALLRQTAKAEAASSAKVLQLDAALAALSALPPG